MKIVHICLGNFYSDGYSYQENMLPRYHRKMGHDVTVIAGLDVFDEHGDLLWLPAGRAYTGDDGVPVIRLDLKGLPLLAKRLKNYRGLYAALEQAQPETVFIHNGQFLCIGDVVRYVKKHPQTAVFVDNHADFSNSATNWVSKNLVHKIVWRSCLQKIAPYTRRFYGVLPARVDFLKNLYRLPAEKCRLLVMGTDDELAEKAAAPAVREAVRREYGIGSEDFLVMTGGKIDAFKTQTLLLMDAVNHSNDPHLKLVVFGSVTPELKEALKSRCSDRVQYIGWQSAADTYPLFAACDLACFPGRHSVFWEQATGQGVPLLVKKWEGTTHVDLGGNVRFLTQDSQEEIRSALEEIAGDKTVYAEMKQVAAEKGKTVFSYRDIAKRSIEG